ncbi:MAG TPA: hypothetical protein VFV34_20345 [Blastocatellia bacterium]|nr:hypothetical protein [Blastocatellia bacterium]
MKRATNLKASISAVAAVLLIAATSGLGQERSGKDAALAGRPTGTAPPGERQYNGAFEEKVIRDAYVRLMRYHTAWLDELAATTDRTNKPEDFITFELRDVHTGSIAEILDEPVSELVSRPTGEVVVVKPNHLVYGNGPAHAYYGVEWGTALGDEAKPDRRTVGEMIRSGGERLADIEKYTSYEVTVRLAGKHRTYRATALHHSSGSGSTAKAEILDEITSEMNSVLADESPRVRSPWAKYVKTGLYLSVAREIADARKQGKPLIPLDSPIGYLPGDESSTSPRDQVGLTLEACVPCSYPVMFRQTTGSNSGNGVIHFEYVWESSSNNLADLASCKVGETLTYDTIPFPSPPYPQGFSPVAADPFVASSGALEDNHLPPPSFVKPYTASTVTATQSYWYKCPCKNNGQEVTLLQGVTIVRTVSQRTDGKWKYEVKKLGVKGKIDPLP